MTYQEAMDLAENMLMDAYNAITDTPDRNREMAKIKSHIGQGFVLFALLKLAEHDASTEP